MLEQLKPIDVYSQLKLTLATWFKTNGYKRAKCQLGWYKQIDDFYIVIWCHIYKHGFDRYEGGSFNIEFQRSSEPTPVHGTRLALFLSDHEREEVRIYQNEVISTLTYPPQSYYEYLPTELIDFYLKRFNSVEKPYHKQNDIWFRYANREHLDFWAKFILKKLPECIDQATSVG